jgi:ectoine hydroxylase-related dioxygenase (phytanoyl-CoA dioxygenase family)
VLADDVVAAYREDGFVHIPSVLGADDVSRYRDAVIAADARLETLNSPTDKTFRQIIQAWQKDEALRGLSLDPELASLATQLAGMPLRLWHDQILIKEPHNGAASHFHQDQPYWPHDNLKTSLSAWIALVDVPVERGCMTFIPGSQRRKATAVDLHNRADFFAVAPELEWEPRVTVPIRAGDCTFHNGYTAHAANPNETDEYRYAFINIYVNEDVTYSGMQHPLTNDIGLEIGDRFPNDLFPPVPLEAGSEPPTARR